MKNKETVDVLRNQNQLSVQGYREGGKGREEEVKRFLWLRPEKSEELIMQGGVSDVTHLWGCHSVRSGKPSE